MRRHVVIGRLGPKDTVLIPIAKDEHETLFPLITGEKTLNYGISDVLATLKKQKVYPSEVALDLIILAVHVYAADTRISRTSESQDTWTRELRLVIPVSKVDVWNNAQPLLSKLLNFLTGDRWTIDFRERPAKYSSLIQRDPKSIFGHTFTSISLFSGGLDSLIGAIDLLENGKIPLFISHAGDGATSKAQDDCFNELKAAYKKLPFDRLRFWLNIPGGIFKGVEGEDSTRGRSFLFFALGVLAGSGIAPKFVLQVPENGLIALNVPLDPLRLGSLSTRTTHPFYMQCWNELLQTLGIDGKLENPYWNRTKGEMVTGCANPKLLETITPLSLSCSSPTKGRWTGKSTGHCGYCLPCLIRRASLQKDSTKYSIQNLNAKPLNTQRSEGRQIRSFQLAIERLRQRPELGKMLIYKPGPLPSDPKIISELAGVYFRGMMEIGKLLSKVRTKPS